MEHFLGEPKGKGLTFAANAQFWIWNFLVKNFEGKDVCFVVFEYSSQ